MTTRTDRPLALESIADFGAFFDIIGDARDACSQTLFDEHTVFVGLIFPDFLDTAAIRAHLLVYEWRSSQEEYGE